MRVLRAHCCNQRRDWVPPRHHFRVRGRAEVPPLWRPSSYHGALLPDGKRGPDTAGLTCTKATQIQRRNRVRSSFGQVQGAVQPGEPSARRGYSGLSTSAGSAAVPCWAGGRRVHILIYTYATCAVSTQVRSFTAVSACSASATLHQGVSGSPLGASAAKQGKLSSPAFEGRLFSCRPAGCSLPRPRGTDLACQPESGSSLGSLGKALRSSAPAAHLIIYNWEPEADAAA